MISDEMIQGEDVTVSILVDAVYYDIFCAVTMDFRLRQDVVLATSANTGIYRRKKLRGLCEWSVTTSGLTPINNGTVISFFYLLQESVRGTEQTIKLDFFDSNGNERTLIGPVIIPELGIDGPVKDFSNADVTFEGSGTLEMDPVTPPASATCEEEDPIYIDAVENELKVHSALLQQTGVVIIAVARSGDVHYETTGTPGALQFKSDLANGDIYFSSSIPFNAGEWVSIEYKIE